MNIQNISVSRINPAPYNPRVDLKPGDPEYEKLSRSMGEFGCVQPPVWNKRTGNLVGGHQRLKVLLQHGAKNVQVVVVDLDLAQEKALNLALNKIAGAWDEHKLAELLQELTATPTFDIGLTGFQQYEVDELLERVLHLPPPGGDDASFDLQRSPDPKLPVVTKPGEIVALGSHRLLCGDCTDLATVKRLMNGERAVLFATDPPYCVAYNGTNHPTGKRGSSSRASNRGGNNKDWSDTYGVSWDDAQPNPELYDKFIAAAIAEAIRPDAAWYCWHASRRQAMVESIWEKHGAFVHCQIIWVKNRPVLTRTWYAWQHEPCFFGWVRPPNGKKPPRMKVDMASTVWTIDTIPNGLERPDHPTPKPLEVFEIPMRQHTKPGELCYEPFAGSGSQLIAAERTGRRCNALEISARYCDVIVRRYIHFVGAGRVPKELAARYAIPATPPPPPPPPPPPAAIPGPIKAARSRRSNRPAGAKMGASR